MGNNLPINIIKDDSVQKKVKKKACKLQKKYDKQRKINEKLLKKKTPFGQTISIIFDVVCFILVIVSLLLCFSAINSKIQKTAPSILGYSNLTIKTESMVASGHEKGDTIIIRAVDTNSLREGDKIAFYCYSEVNRTFDINTCEGVDGGDIIERSYAPITFKSVLGIHSDEIKAAAKANTPIVFHEIIDVVTDQSGHRWFETKGSSNPDSDFPMLGYIKDTMVLGVYVETPIAVFWSSVINVLSSVVGILVILIPVLLMGVILFLESVREVQLTKLEQDVVEEKRRLTDPICVKYGVGYYMSTKTKYKVLAQADDELKAEYISLLWKKGVEPKGIKKYALRKKLLLRGNRKLLLLNRECEKMFNERKAPTKIASYYIKEKEKIDNEQLRYERLIRSLGKKNKN